MVKSIEKLQEQRARIDKKIADELARTKDANIAKVKKDIEFFGLTQKDLFGVGGKASGVGIKKTRAKRKGVTGPDGQHWSGYGPKPQWVHALEKAGNSAKPAARSAKSSPAEKLASKKPARKALKPKITAERSATLKGPAKPASKTKSSPTKAPKAKSAATKTPASKVAKKPAPSKTKAAPSKPKASAPAVAEAPLAT